MLGYSYGKRFGLKIAWANRKKSDRVGVGPGTEQIVEGSDPHGSHGRVCEGDIAHVGVSHGMAEVKLSCFLLSFSSCKRGYLKMWLAKWKYIQTIKISGRCEHWGETKAITCSYQQNYKTFCKYHLQKWLSWREYWREHFEHYTTIHYTKLDYSKKLWVKGSH